jgi:hypothetical protein
MTPKEKAPSVRAEVVTVRPALMRDSHAAAYLGKSPSWIRAARAADTKLRKEGLEPAGPPWIVLGSSIMYRVADLDDWIARHAVERGVVEFSNRGGGE